MEFVNVINSLLGLIVRNIYVRITVMTMEFADFKGNVHVIQGKRENFVKIKHVRVTAMGAGGV
jgi:hypothetical protein